MDPTGRYPITSVSGYNYMFVLYNYDSNYITVEPICSCKTKEYICVFKQYYQELKEKGFTTCLLWLDNEVSADVIASLQEEKFDIQIDFQGYYCLSHAECAIQTLKLYFISTCTSANPSFLGDFWDLPLKSTLLIINLVRPSCINLDISAYIQIHVIFNSNTTPLAPPGCHVIIHD